MRKAFFIPLLFGLLLLSSCRGVRFANPQLAHFQGEPIPVEEFQREPFGHSGSIADFMRQLQDLPPQKLILRNMIQPHFTDSVYAFKTKGVQLLVHKALSGKETLMGIEITNPNFQFRNGVHVGITYEKLRTHLAHLPPFAPIITLPADGNIPTINFYFTPRRKLERITILAH